MHGSVGTTVQVRGDGFPSCGPIEGFSIQVRSKSECPALGQTREGCRYFQPFDFVLAAGTANGESGTATILVYQTAFPVGMVIDQVNSTTVGGTFLKEASYHTPSGRSIFADIGADSSSDDTSGDDSNKANVNHNYRLNVFDAPSIRAGVCPWPRMAPLLTTTDPLYLTFVRETYFTVMNVRGYLVMEVPYMNAHTGREVHPYYRNSIQVAA